MNYLLFPDVLTRLHELTFQLSPLVPDMINYRLVFVSDEGENIGTLLLYWHTKYLTEVGELTTGDRSILNSTTEYMSTWCED